MYRILLLTILFFFSIFASHGQRFEYEKSSNIFFGFNMGSTWHTTDVVNHTRVLGGAGFILGGTIGRDYGRALSLDLRLRYLGGRWYGLDIDTTSGLSNNLALSEIYGSGQAIQNFRATNHSLALELALHANRFRERSGLDPYVFGGVGVKYTNTEGDLLDENGVAYDYLNNPSSTFSAQGYESPLDLNETTKYEADVNYFPEGGNFHHYWAPSLGFGIGYYFNTNFSLGLEHKTTFTLYDYFDGTTIDQNGLPNDKNDLYHYTNLYARWYLRKADREVAEVPFNTNPVVAETNTLNQKPEVIYTNPNEQTRVVNSPTFVLRANIVNVTSAQNVTFRQDGTINSNFIFNPLTQKFESTVQLNPGQNIFTLFGKNEFGSDEETVVLIYERAESNTLTPPTVVITNPSSSPFTTENSSHVLSASIQNVNSKDQVKVQINNVSTSNFNYSQISPSQAQISVALTLSTGVTTIDITATNVVGQDSDQATIIKREIQIEQSPLVSYTNPSNSNITVTKPYFGITGQLLNVYSKENVAFIQNGNANYNFSFDSITKKFSSQIVLVPGENIFQLVGINSVGQDQATVVINYAIPSPKPPIITITNPSVKPYSTSNDSHNVLATILNVSSANQISVLLNGSSFTNFNFNGSSGQFSSTISLIEGSNIFQITATNSDGTDSKETVIIYTKPAVLMPPVVSFINPSTNPFQTNQSNLTIVSTVSNVNNQNQINVNVNGQQISNLAFNSTTHVLSFNSGLILGANVVTITATNSAGVDSESQTIIYSDPTIQLPPVVNFQDPSINPTTVYNSIYPVIAKVENVAGPQNIQLKINQIASTNFVYTPSSELMSFNTSLQEGANVIEIKATNAYGQDVKTTTILYRKSNPILPPVVDIQSPATNPYTTNQNTVNIVASVLNVSSASEISVLLNSSSINNFNYNTSSKFLTFQANLNNGQNNISISATNSAGTATDSQVINYNPIQVVQPPLVSFVNPSSPGNEVNSSSYQMVAHVENVTNANGISVTFNGQTVNPSLFDFNTLTQQVIMNTSLSQGNNVFSVTATNSAGSSSASTNISYLQPVVDCNEPLITIYAPASNPFTTEEDNLNLKASIQNIKSSQMLNIKLNGVVQNNFNYSSSTKELILGINLTEGNNVIEIEATNNCGMTQANTTIVFTPVTAPCEPPVLTRMSPQLSRINSLDETIFIQSSSVNISQPTELSFSVNGIVSSFNFDAGTQIISADIPLIVGSNNIVLVATNDCGTSELTWQISRQECHDPTVNITHNGSVSNGSVSNNQVSVSGIVQDADNLEFSLNDVAQNYIYDANSGSFTANLLLAVGNNIIELNAINSCGNTKQTLNINYVEPQTSCGPRFNPGNSDWQFCLITPTNSYNRTDLSTNPNFSYSGLASSVYFMPIAGGGDAVVNGSPYPLQNGSYYLFEGNLTVTVSSTQPGSMGHWTICIESDQLPVFGNGNNRPASPCEGSNKSMEQEDKGTTPKPNLNNSGGTSDDIQRGNRTNRSGQDYNSSRSNKSGSINTRTETENNTSEPENPTKPKENKMPSNNELKKPEENKSEDPKKTTLPQKSGNKGGG